MIQEINIRNFKALKNIRLQPKGLNLLMGLNGMGKSSFIQSMLLLKQSKNIISGRANLNGELVEIGKGKDAMYQFSQVDTIYISIKSSESDKFEWNFKYNPESDFLDSNDPIHIRKLFDSPIFNDHFQYLHAERSGPKAIYDTSFQDVIYSDQIGIYGQFAVHFLNVFGSTEIKNINVLHPRAKSNILIHQAEAWLSEITPGLKLNTTDIAGTDKVLIDYQFENGSSYTNRFRPKNVGFGISYVLPVIVTLLSASKDKLIIIENPESHIHPRGQAELGKLIAKATTVGAQIFIETHSDHILNGIRVAVKERLVPKDDVGIFYFERFTQEGEQFSDFTSIRMDENGELSEYPSNFMDEWNNQLLNLL